MDLIVTFINWIGAMSQEAKRRDELLTEKIDKLLVERDKVMSTMDICEPFLYFKSCSVYIIELIDYIASAEAAVDKTVRHT